MSLFLIYYCRFLSKRQIIQAPQSLSRASSNVKAAFSSSSFNENSPPQQQDSHNNHNTNDTTSFSSLQEQFRKDILTSSLQKVHEYGWTEDAIAHGIVSNPLKKYPPSFIGMMNDNHSKSSDLIHFFMKESNLKLKAHLDELFSKENDGEGKKEDEGRLNSIFSPDSHSRLLKYGIKYRLEMVIPYVQSNRWSEGMALGAKPYNAMSTATHLEEIVNILQGSLRDEHGNPIVLSQIHRTAIGAVYVTTELHLLADTSPGFKDTWSFLSDRMDQLDEIQESQSILPQFNQDTLVAGVAVASSLGSAVLSLLTPAARTSASALAGAVAPQVMNVMSYASSGPNAFTSMSSSPPGTTAKDYDFSDLPPFEDNQRK